MKTLKLLLFVIVAALLVVSCQYTFIIPEEVPVIPDGPNAEQVSFSQSVLPIFNNNNNCTACHKTGGQSPDLTSGKAYASLNNARYINKTTPEESLLYLHPNPDTSTHQQKKYTATQAAIVLTWITQGAKNN